MIWILVFGWVLTGLLSATVWRSKGGSFEAAFILGVIFGVFALMYVGVMRPAVITNGTSRQHPPSSIKGNQAYWTTKPLGLDGGRVVAGGERLLPHLREADSGNWIMHLEDGTEVLVPEAAAPYLSDAPVSTPSDEQQPILLTEPEEKECPRCAETVKFRAKVCRYCGYEFEADNRAPSQDS